MTKRMIGMGSIEQFRTIVKNVQRTAQFVSYNEETKEVITNKNAKMPVITFTGTTKIHGTNAGWAYTKDEQWCQSRKNIITPEKDNAGCAFKMMSLKNEFNEICEDLVEKNNIDLNKQGIVLFMEFAGGNIQKNVAINGTNKSFYIFEYAKVFDLEVPEDEDSQNYWIKTETTKEFDLKDKDIYWVKDFKQFSIDIDFDRPDIAQNIMVDETTKVGDECPVGKYFGISGVGEGIVYSYLDGKELLRFKSKDDRHSKGAGKVKTLKPVDEELQNKKIKFVNEFACSEGRLGQMFTEIVHSTHNGDNTLMSMKDMGSYLRLVVNDVIKEESDRMSQR